MDDKSIQGEMSTVILAKSPELLQGTKKVVRKDVLARLFNKSIMRLSGRKNPRDAWSAFIRKDDVVGLKPNCLAGAGMSPRREVIDIIIDGLKLAGVPEKNIVIWERSDSDLISAGYKINTRGNGVRCYGCDNRMGGYDREPTIVGSFGGCFASFVSTKCTALINIPVLKDHDLSGVCIGMKNFFGAIHNPNRYHDNNCDPYISLVNSHPYIKDKLRLIICDAIVSQYHGGPAFKPQWCWDFSGMIMSDDPVALDRIGADIIENKRKEKNLPSLKEEKREPVHIHTAAEMGLGIDDRERIEVVEISI